MTIQYSCEGSVRGRCGIKHRSLRTAAICCHRDHLGCVTQGGYSDRQPFAIEDGIERALTDDELDESQAYKA